MLLEAVYKRSVDGVRVLLKHGAQRDIARWGDGIPITALEAAEDKPEILALLLNPDLPVYVRKKDPDLSAMESSKGVAINLQGEIRDAKGLVFQIGDPEQAG